MKVPRSGTSLDEEAEYYRRVEREWQNEIGYALLDKPYEIAGSAAVFTRQWGRIAKVLDEAGPGPVVEVGCGKGHLLRWLYTEAAAPQRRFIGIDISRAVKSLATDRIDGVVADGEQLPFRSASVSALIYDGALHHLIDYVDALTEAFRVLAPGGLLILFEPLSSPFSRAIHHLLDPLIFRKTVYESPIDQKYKDAFDEEVIARHLSENGTVVIRRRTDFLAYPLTGCYAGSIFSRSETLMRNLIKLEQRIGRSPALNRIAVHFAWRFLLVARKGNN